MAERRMFTMKIVDSDAFLDMPASAQALYFHLNMRADDDGFVNNPKRIQRYVGASEDDLKLLIVKRFILTFESGVIVIKHWRMHNALRKDRYNPTQYQEEMALLSLKENGAYTEAENLLEAPWEGVGNQMATTWQPNGNQMATQDRLGKDRIGKVSIDKGEKADAFSTFAQDDEEMLTLLKEFEAMRKRQKKPMTDRAKQMLVDKLKSFPEERRKPALEESIYNCWSSVYDHSDKEPKKTAKQKAQEETQKEWGRPVDASETDRLLRLTKEMQG